MSNSNKNDFRDEILKNNKILYCMNKRPATETCMCWGLEVPDTWLDEVSELSMKLEGINNMIYPLFNVRIQADQVKSKYGTLHFYYSIVIDPPSFIKGYEKMIGRMMDWLRKLDYDVQCVVDKEEHDEEIIETISKEEFDKYLNEPAGNVDAYAKGGKFFKKVVMHRPRKVHYEARKHKFWYRVFLTRWHMKNLLRKILRWNPSYRQECVAKFLDGYAEAVIEKAIERCSCLCEKCGKHIGTDYSPRCTTHGWVSYLCKSCADKSGQRYSCDGKVWENGKAIDSKNEDDDA